MELRSFAVYLLMAPGVLTQEKDIFIELWARESLHMMRRYSTWHHLEKTCCHVKSDKTCAEEHPPLNPLPKNTFIPKHIMRPSQNQHLPLDKQSFLQNIQHFFAFSKTKGCLEKVARPWHESKRLTLENDQSQLIPQLCPDPHPGWYTFL